MIYYKKECMKTVVTVVRREPAGGARECPIFKAIDSRTLIANYSNMISVFWLLVILLLVLAVVVLYQNTRKPKKFPPGPTWYPLLGCSHVVQVMSKKHGSQWKGLLELARVYSTQVLGLKLGLEQLIVVYGEKNVRQVFTEKEFEGRPNSFFIKLRCLGKRMGITFADGPLWREQRQFTVKHLKHVGFGKTEMEQDIQHEMQQILDSIERQKGKAIDPKTILSKAVMNVLWKYVAGEKIDEKRLEYLLGLFYARSKAFSMAGGWLNQVPWIRHIFPKLSGYELISKMNQQISDIIEEAITKHKNNAVGGSDFIYLYLKEMKEGKLSFNEEQLKIICLDLLIAGSQTTSNLLLFALLSVLRHRRVQEKIYAEIKDVVGDETPRWSHNSRLPYTSAFLFEVQRHYAIAPLAGPRRVLKNTIIDGYFIPKDTTVLISVGDLHFDPTIWTDADQFMPDRFIDETGTLKNLEHLYTFGLGRRRCPGDSMARSFLFIAFVGIMQKYRVECSNGVLPSAEPTIGIISAPKPFTANFVPRCSY